MRELHAPVGMLMRGAGVVDARDDEDVVHPPRYGQEMRLRGVTIKHMSCFGFRGTQGTGANAVERSWKVMRQKGS